MRRLITLLALSGITVAGAIGTGCSGEGSHAPDPNQPLHFGSGSDPAGDGATVDLLSASIAVTGDSLVLASWLTPSSMLAKGTMATFLIDADGLGTTGDTSQDPAIGVDYLVLLAESIPQPFIFRYQVDHFVIVAAAGHRLVGADSVAGTIPLALLGGDDGILRFKVKGSYLDANSNLVYDDWLTNAGQFAVKVL